MKDLFLFISFVIFLSSCGGNKNSTRSAGETNSTPVSSSQNNADSYGWKTVEVSKYSYASGVISVFNESIYLTFRSNTSNNIYKTNNGKDLLAIPSNGTGGELIFISNGRLLSSTAYSDDGIQFMLYLESKTKDIMKSMYAINGNSSTLLGVKREFCYGGYEECSNIYRSLDNGMSWGKIVIDPSATNRNSYLFNLSVLKPIAFNGDKTFILANQRAGLWVSQNAGSSWNKVLEKKGKFDVVSSNPLFKNVFFAARYGEIYKSMDKGVTWLKLKSPLYNGKIITKYIDLKLLDNGELVAWGVGMGDTRGVIFSSFDNTDNWQLIGEGKGRDDDISEGEIIANTNYYFIRDWTRVYMKER